MEQAAEEVQEENKKNKLKSKYSRKSSVENVLDGNLVKIVRYKTKDAKRLKEKYSVKKSDALVPFDENFLNSIKNRSNLKDKMDSAEEQTNKSTSDSKDEISPKVNVFHFMMKSRYKVIGSNSPGKEKKPEEEKSPEKIAENKEKLNNRKNLLGEWAEKKGGQKRKLAEEAQDKHIKKKMNERAKRLKKMLEIIDEDLRNSSHDEVESDTDVVFTPKKINKKKFIQSDSEPSNDSTDVKLTTPAETKSNNKIKKQKISNENNDNKKVKNNNKKLKTTSKKSKEQKNNFSDSENSLDSLEKKLESNKELESKQIQNNSKENNTSIDNKCDENNESNGLNEKINTNLEKNEDNKLNTSDKTPKNEIKSSKKKRTLRSLSLKKSKESPNATTSSEKTEENHIDDDDTEDIFPIKKTDTSPVLKTPSTARKTRQLKLFNESSSKTPKEEVYSPRSWKMKVRLFEKENIVDENDEDKEEIIVINEESPKKTQKQGKILNFFSSSNSSISTNDSKKKVKIAPLFLRQPKTKADIAAKKSFLFSGMPDQVKKIITKQQSIQEIDYEIFPKISHVQQRKTENDSLSILWDLPNTSLLLIEKKLNNDIDLIYDKIKIGTFSNCKSNSNYDHIIAHKQLHFPPKKLPNIKELIKQLKNMYPYYPVYKMFRLLHEKYSKNINESVSKIDISQNLNESASKRETSVLESTPKTESKKRKRGRPKRSKSPIKEQSDNVIDKPVVQKENLIYDSQMWTEKYKPQCQDDIIGNFSSVKELKSWLESWVTYSENQKTMKKRKRLNSNSSDDFCSDSDTRDTDILPQNMIILTGPYGSGKTSSVYALCNELNINVIEINASSKRPGKRILSELQEATQSHQVKNTDSKSVNFFQKKTDITSSKDEENKKLSLLLMEDVEIVFDDQDDGFISSLTTLISTSKRPIILTTSDKDCLHLQKLISQYQVIEFTLLSNRVAGPWLQILCLIEGVCVNSDKINRLLQWNKGDIRKTILQLQFWVLTGGDSILKSTSNNASNLTTDLIKNKINKEISSENDESSNLSWLTDSNCEKLENTIIHNSCVSSFVPYYERDKTDFQLIFPIDLGIIWWNSFSLLNMKPIKHTDNYKTEIKSNNDETSNSNESDIDCSQNATKVLSDTENTNSDIESVQNENLQCKSTNPVQDISDLCIVADFLESLVFTDITYTNLKLDCNFEPTFKYWHSNPTDSLLLSENFEMYNASNNISLEISQWLVEHNLNHCKKISGVNNQNDFDVDISVPNLDESKWRSKIHKSMQDISNMIPMSCILDRTAICKDYLPVLRAMCRTENSRSVNTNKRKNRFYHYFKTFNIHLSESAYSILCNSLVINE